MIDAVSTLSVQSNAARVTPQASAPVPAVSSSSSIAAEQSYASSRIRVDNYLDMAILEVRSTDTGDVIRQYPSEYQIRAFQRASEITSRSQSTSEKAARAEALLQQEYETSDVSETSSAPAPTSTAPAAVFTSSAPAPSSGGDAVTFSAPVTYSSPAATGGSFSGASQASAASSQSVTV